MITGSWKGEAEIRHDWDPLFMACACISSEMGDDDGSISTSSLICSTSLCSDGSDDDWMSVVSSSRGNL